MQVNWFKQKTTARFLRKVRNTLPGCRIDLVWDNARWHQGEDVRQEMASLRLHEHRLPSYSPEMNAGEYFIRWAKSMLSYHFCWDSVEALRLAFRGFVASLVHRAREILKRCKPKMSGFSPP